jgi:hypothetical protein
MTRSKEAQPNQKTEEGTPEKASRLLRNFNALIGGIALGGAAIAPPLLAAPLAAYGGFNMLQAGGFEWIRRKAKKSREKR